MEELVGGPPTSRRPRRDLRPVADPSSADGLHTSGADGVQPSAGPIRPDGPWGHGQGERTAFAPDLSWRNRFREFKGHASSTHHLVIHGSDPTGPKRPCLRTAAWTRHARPSCCPGVPFLCAPVHPRCLRPMPCSVTSWPLRHAGSVRPLSRGTCCWRRVCKGTGGLMRRLQVGWLPAPQGQSSAEQSPGRGRANPGAPPGGMTRSPTLPGSRGGASAAHTH